MSSRLRKRKGVLEQCSERKTKQKTAKGNEPADSGQDFDHVRFNSADAQKRYEHFSKRNFIEEFIISFGEVDAV